MIKWEDIEQLHVINKLEQVLQQWFGVELFYTDAYGNIKSRHLQKDFEFVNQFFKVQMQLPAGPAILGETIEQVIEEFKRDGRKTGYFNSSFPHVRGIASMIEVDGEVEGVIFAYPYMPDTCTEVEIEEIRAKLIEVGATEADAQLVVDKLKRTSNVDRSYLQELVDLVAGEVASFHSEISKREERIQELNSELGDKYRYHMMVGKSKKMQQIYRLLERVAPSDTSLMVQGENGTGKELVAKAVHYFSPRKDNVFLAVNCSAFNDNLLDSELFGHVKGAFTGAIKDKKGLFEQADGGTLFLDEIGDTSLSMQVKLLRVLQEGTFLPVGATTPKKANVRIIAATNKDLKKMIADGEFREDLFYRINVINVTLPPLRERKDDIPLLIEHFLKKRCDEAGMPLKSIAKRCMEKLLDYNWPGNVRELENEIERLVVLAGEDKVIHHDLLSPRILDYGREAPVALGNGINTSGTLKAALEELEAIMIKEGLKRCNYNKSRLAKELGVSRASLIMKVDKYGLDKRKQAANE